MKKIIRVVDVETGHDPIEGEPGIIEIGFTDLIATQVDMLGQPYQWEISVFRGFSALVNPGRPITPETSAVHSLIDSDVADAQSWDQVKTYLMSTDFYDLYSDTPDYEIVALCGHGTKDAEQKLIGTDITGETPWICTYKVALHLWPDAPNHKNGTVRYYLNPKGLDRERAFPPHRALPDSYVTAFTLREALNAGHTVEELVKWTIEPALIARCKIGKDYNNNGKGTPWKDVETSMLHWILGKDFDEDTMYTVRHHLKQREIDARLKAQELDLNAQYAANGMDAMFDPQPGRFGPVETQPAAPVTPAPQGNNLELDI